MFIFYNCNTISDTLLLKSTVITTNLLKKLIANQFLLYFIHIFIIVILYFHPDTLPYTSVYINCIFKHCLHSFKFGSIPLIHYILTIPGPTCTIFSFIIKF